MNFNIRVPRGKYPLVFMVAIFSFSISLVSCRTRKFGSSIENENLKNQLGGVCAIAKDSSRCTTKDCNSTIDMGTGEIFGNEEIQYDLVNSEVAP